MNKAIPKCAFAKAEIRGFYRCIAITADKCNGFDRKCSFYKSEDRHIADQDRAIDICRKKRGLQHLQVSEWQSVQKIY